MSNIKFLTLGCTVILGVTSAFAEPPSLQETAAAFSGLIVCDGSKRAEKVCKTHCTGDHLLLFTKGTCQDQTVWNYCLRVCRKDWIEDCAKTATKNNLTGLARCQ